VPEFERRYRELFNSVPVGCLVTNWQGVIQEANPAAVHLLNGSVKSLEGVSLARFLGQEQRASFFATLRQLTRGEKATVDDWQMVLQPHDRSAFPAALTVDQIGGGPGRLPRLRWMIRDLSARRQAEEETLRLNVELEQRVRERTAALEAANRELEAFTYSVSHDLRAPLRSLNGFTKALLEDYSDKLDEQGVRYLEFAHEASERMGRLIEDLLDLSRVSRGELSRQKVDLGAVGASVMKELQKQEPQRSLEVIIAPKLIAQGDEGLLRIALANLLSNAWKFTNRQLTPRIELGAIQQNGAPVFFVRDNGAGFNMANANRLFGVFQRLHSQDEFPGTGVGLATVHRILVRHGGNIWAESQVDQGATFYFTLPES
jgi:PAS domain S-box-containing protein